MAVIKPVHKLRNSMTLRTGGGGGTTAVGYVIGLHKPRTHVRKPHDNLTQGSLCRPSYRGDRGTPDQCLAHMQWINFDNYILKQTISNYVK